ncbi:MAG: ATP synthase F1 subunit gamma [Candidatus Staskawiczbacteria bacterium]|nr:ATP synthase F1 subunit gamma [Candidatus Staskawiczbacteria bacterium]
MESPQNVKKRLKSVKNIKQITKAMELVSATKMRKSQQIALDSRPYAFLALNLLATVSNLNQSASWRTPELFKIRKIKKVLFVLVSSDKGLAGAFNSSVIKKFEQHMQRDKEKYAKEEKFFVAVGEKSFAYLSKKNVDIVKKFVQVGDHTTPEQVEPLTDFIIKRYLEKKWDRVVIFSTHFRSALKQEPHVRRILPIDFNHIKETVQELIPERGKFADLIKEHNISFVPDKNKLKEYLIEPSAEKVLSKLARHLFFMQVYHLILEANASEHSARRLAMKTASDNASDLAGALNLQYNKSRQSAITKEITEIIAGAEAQS